MKLRLARRDMTGHVSGWLSLFCRDPKAAATDLHGTLITISTWKCRLTPAEHRGASRAHNPAHYRERSPRERTHEVVVFAAMSNI